MPQHRPRVEVALHNDCRTTRPYRYIHAELPVKVHDAFVDCSISSHSILDSGTRESSLPLIGR